MQFQYTVLFLLRACSMHRSQSCLAAVCSTVRPPRRGLPRPNCHSQGFTSWTLLFGLALIYTVVASAQPNWKLIWAGIVLRWSQHAACCGISADFLLHWHSKALMSFLCQCSGTGTGRPEWPRNLLKAFLCQWHMQPC